MTTEEETEEEEANYSMRIISLVLSDFTRLVNNEKTTSRNEREEGEDEDDGGVITEPPKKASRTMSTAVASSGGKRGGGQGKLASKGTGGAATSSASVVSSPYYYDDSGNNYSELSSILSSRVANHISFDCYVSIRRWAGLAFGCSLCSGHKRLLEMCAVMLNNAEKWGRIMELTDNSSGGGAVNVSSSLPLSGSGVDSSTTAAAAVPSRRKKRKKSNEKPVTSSAKQPLSFSFDSDAVDTMDRSTSGSDHCCTAVPGNLALIIFVSSVIDMIYDAGVTGGMSPPSSGWMDEYIKAVLGGDNGIVSAVDNEANLMESYPATEAIMSAPPTPVAATTVATETDHPTGVRRSSRQRSKSTKGSTETTNAVSTVATGSPRRVGPTSASASPRSRGGSRVSNPSVWIRPDIRNEAAVVTKCLIEQHLQTMNDNVNLEKQYTERLALLNDDDSYFGLAVSLTGKRRSPSATSRSSEESIAFTSYYYPFMHRTLETIERIVASSNTATNGNKNTILALGSAVALGRFFHCYEKERESDTAVVLDAKLISFAVYQLSGCFDRVLAENGKSDGKSSSPAVTPPGAIPPSLLQTYRLNDPLTSSHKDLDETAGAAASSSSYGGVFGLDDIMPDSAFTSVGTDKRSPRGSASTSPDTSGISNEAGILSLYIRAQLAPGVKAFSSSSSSIPTASYDAAMTSLLQSLLAIVRICYNFSLEMHCQRSDSSIDDKPSLTKKSTSSTKKKRRASESATSILELAGLESPRLVNGVC